MHIRNKDLLLLTILVLGIALTAPETAPEFRADELHPPMSAVTQGAAGQGAATQGAATQGSWEAVTLGRVEPRAGDIKITAPLPGGRIADVLVKPNEEVFAGELLVRLDDEEALARVAEADAQVALHKRARNDQAAPAASADRRKAEDAAADAERSVADARAALDKTTADLRAGSASKADLDAGRSALSRAEDRLREKRDALAKLKASADTPLPTRLEGELNVAQAEWRVAAGGVGKDPNPRAGGRRRAAGRRQDRRIVDAVDRTSDGGHWRRVGLAGACRGQRAGSPDASGSGRVCWCAPAPFHGREFEGKACSSVARVVGPSRINSGDPRKFSDVDVLEVLVDLPSPGPLVVGEQVDAYFKSDRAEQVETQ